MIRTLALTTTLALSIGLAAAPPQSAGLTAAEQKEGFKVLFDGKTTTGWTARAAAPAAATPAAPAPTAPAIPKWQVENGEIVAVKDSGRGHLVTNQPYGDFVLRLDFWIDAEANSGVFIRAPESGPINATNAYEVNIFDAHEQWPSGSINNIQRTIGAPKTVGKWNTFEITAQGDHLMLVLNGEKTLDTKSNLHARGPFGLQYNGAGMVKFRNVRIKAL